MKTERVSLRLALLFLIGVVGARPVLADDAWHATKSEAAQLPLFCWGQLMSDEFRGPEYQILDCGPFMNHYCLGLLKIVRANRTIGNIEQKKSLPARRADRHRDYIEGYEALPELFHSRACGKDAPTDRFHAESVWQMIARTQSVGVAECSRE